jgi:hypothetical protein
MPDGAETGLTGCWKPDGGPIGGWKPDAGLTGCSKPDGGLAVGSGRIHEGPPL